MNKGLQRKKNTYLPTAVPAKLLQQKRAKGYEPESMPQIVHEVLRTPGRPFDAETRAFFESKFGHDFSQVRVHTDAKAAESALAVNALAYTVGRDIVFGATQFKPDRTDGKRLIAHELAHVIQQRRGGLATESASRNLERSANQAAHYLISGRSFIPVHGASGVGLARQEIVEFGTPETEELIKFWEDRIKSEPDPSRRRRYRGYIRNLRRGGRPTGAQAEEEMRYFYRQIGPAEERAYKLGSQVPRGGPRSKGSTKPDIPLSSADIEVKARDITNPKNAERIINEIARQTTARREGGRAYVRHHPVILDLRGQTINRANINSFVNALSIAAQIPIDDIQLVVNKGQIQPPQKSLSTVQLVTKPTGPAVMAVTTSGRGVKAATKVSPSERGGTTAVVGTPEVHMPPLGRPSARGEAIGAGIALTFQGLNIIFNWINDWVQVRRVREALAKIEPGITRTRAESPSLGVQMYFFYTQVQAPPESLTKPGAVFDHIEISSGRTEDEAHENWQNTPKIRREIPSGSIRLTQRVWIPPLKPASISKIRTPFPSVAIGTFAPGRTKMQDVKWGGIFGFDDMRESTVELAPGMMPRFLILKLPKQLEWFNGTMRMVNTIPVEERTAAEGGTVPVVNLDPTLQRIRLGNVTAACVFPCDDSTAILFDETRPTFDLTGQIKAVNFGLARWIRPENIKIIRRL